MNDWTLAVGLVLLASVLWVTGAVLHWHTIRRQEKLIARLRRLSLRRRPPREPGPLPPVRPPTAGEQLEPAKRWTVG
jgi:hypothetical protein